MESVNIIFSFVSLFFYKMICLFFWIVLLWRSHVIVLSVLIVHGWLGVKSQCIYPYWFYISVLFWESADWYYFLFYYMCRFMPWYNLCVWRGVKNQISVFVYTYNVVRKSTPSTLNSCVLQTLLEAYSIGVVGKIGKVFHPYSSIIKSPSLLWCMPMYVVYK